jgi:hypothetical protein
MKKTCLTTIALLLSVLLFAGYKFITGSVSAGKDGRQVVQLNAGERDLVLKEMRGFLHATQQIIEAANGNDMAALAASARRGGKAAVKGVPMSLHAKLPLAFKQLGHDTHSQFDQIALDAEQMGDASLSLSQLSNILKNCVSCHEIYRLAVDK